MRQSISHWGQFEIQASGTENFKETLDPIVVAWSEFSPLAYDAKYLHEKPVTYQHCNFGPELP